MSASFTARHGWPEHAVAASQHVEPTGPDRAALTCGVWDGVIVRHPAEGVAIESFLRVEGG